MPTLLTSAQRSDVPSCWNRVLAGPALAAGLSSHHGLSHPRAFSLNDSVSLLSAGGSVLLSALRASALHTDAFCIQACSFLGWVISTWAWLVHAQQHALIRGTVPFKHAAAGSPLYV